VRDDAAPALVERDLGAQQRQRGGRRAPAVVARLAVGAPPHVGIDRAVGLIAAAAPPAVGPVPEALALGAHEPAAPGRPPARVVGADRPAGVVVGVGAHPPQLIDAPALAVRGDVVGLVEDRLGVGVRRRHEAVGNRDAAAEVGPVAPDAAQHHVQALAPRGHAVVRIGAAQPHRLQRRVDADGGDRRGEVAVADPGVRGAVGALGVVGELLAGGRVDPGGDRALGRGRDRYVVVGERDVVGDPRIPWRRRRVDRAALGGRRRDGGSGRRRGGRSRRRAGGRRRRARRRRLLGGRRRRLGRGRRGRCRQRGDRRRRRHGLRGAACPRARARAPAGRQLRAARAEPPDDALGREAHAQGAAGRAGPERRRAPP